MLRISALCVAFQLADLLFAQVATVVEGRVTNALTGAPIEGVTVGLNEVAGRAAYSAKTDAAGSFRIAAVKPGEYFANFESRDFMVPPDQPQRRFHVTPVSELVRLDAKLTPLARLRGRVMDSESRPAAGVRVDVIRWRGAGLTTARTNEQGEFVFETIIPGKYILAASPRPLALFSGRPSKGYSAPAPKSVEGERLDWVPTYFPGGSDRAGAQPITLHPGVEERYDLRLGTEPVYGIRGFVVDDQGKPAAGVRVMLTQAERFSLPEQEVTSAADGAFEFPSVRKGEWHLIAQPGRGEPDLRGFAVISVVRSDVENLEVRLGPPFTLTGFVSLEGSPDAKGRTAIFLIPVEGPREKQAGGFTEPNSEWRITAYPGRYTILPVGIVRGYYVASVLLGEQEVLGKSVNLTAPAPPLRIVYKPNAGRARGTVEKGEGATVVLLPKSEALLDRQFIRSARCGAGGRFDVDSIRPGDYYALAFDRVDSDALEDPVFVRSLASRAVTLIVREGETVTVELRVTPWPEP